ncbi:MAG TPA: molybdopterin-synthase adenylyltransferase MoeB [Gemmatimonadaceae bacterium]|jgi:adenylyltransferase/sulfurtransferase|nr:molybdopterin-synthase adenylyltransferase MoeB [Gemmatimonadaceae bacterium]
MPLSSDELRRYARQLVLPQLGRDGQERLRASSVLVAGLGGLGSPVALYLAAAGVGRLGLLDFDTVALHNLHRQVLHGTASVDDAKVDSARRRLEDLNPHVRLDTWQTVLSSANARGIVSDYDIVVDGTDSFSTRYLINDACVLERKPNVQASIHRFEGQLSVFGAESGPCYRCLHPEPPPAGSVPNCAEGGVFGVLPGLMGMLQATETLKLLLGVGDPLIGRLLIVETLGMRFREVQVERDPQCEWCATRERTELLADYAAFCGESAAATTAGSAAGSSAAGTEVASAATADAELAARREIAPAELSMRLARGEGLLVVDVREPWEHDVGSIEGAQLMPMQSVPAGHGSLPRDRTIVVYCHHGMRSAMVADYLRAAGFSRVLNLEGGIDRWSVEVDPSVPRY